MCDDLEVDEEEDFQSVPLDDHWTTEEIPDRHLCIHEHSVPHTPCPHPCLYMDYTSMFTTTHWISVTFLNLRP